MIWTVLAAPVLAGGENADAIALAGEAFEGATVERVETHPEYQRYWLRFQGGALVPIEITRASAGHEGQCTAGDVTMYARVELAEGTPPADVATPTRALCERMETHPPVLRSRTDPKPRKAERVTEQETRVYPLHAAILAWAAAAVVALAGAGRKGWRAFARGERNELVAVALVGVAARLALAPEGIFNGGGAAWEKLVLAWGTDNASPYGDGWPALLGPALAVLGRAPEHVFAVVRAWACLAPPLMWVVARQCGGRVAALAAGLALALLPLHVGMSATEAMHVPILTLELVAVAAALGAARGGGGALSVLAALSAGLAANTRTEAMAFLPVPAAILLLGRARGRWVALAVLAGLASLRVGAMLQPQHVLNPTPAAYLVAFWPRLGEPVQSMAFSVFLHAGLTPPVLWAFALAGLAFAPPRVRALAALWWACTELPVVTKVSPLADAWRLQLVAQPVWLLLVGIGAEGLARIVPRNGRAVAWGLGALLAVGLLRTPPGPDWAHQREYRFLAGAVPRLAATDTVLYEDSASRAIKFGLVMETLGPARWVPATPWLDGADSGPTLVYLGLGCAGDGAALCERIRGRCAIAPLAEETIGPPADLDLPLPEGGARIGLYRVTSCGGPAASADAHAPTR